MIIKDGSTKIVNFMTAEAGILVLGCGHMIIVIPVVKKIFLSTPKHTSDKLSI